MKSKRSDGFKSRHASGKSKKRREDMRKRKRENFDEFDSDSGEEHIAKIQKQREDEAARKKRRENGEVGPEGSDKRVKRALKDRHIEAKKVRRREEKHKVLPFRKNFLAETTNKATKKGEDDDDEDVNDHATTEKSFAGGKTKIQGKQVAPVDENEDEEMQQEVASDEDQSDSSDVEGQDKDQQEPQQKQHDEEEAGDNAKTNNSVDSLRVKLGLVVTSTTPCPAPVTSIDDPRLPATFTEYMNKVGFKQPAPVQAQCWPACLTGRWVHRCWRFVSIKEISNI
jgi:hypothetical protein